MTGYRFDAILSNIHVNDNCAIPVDNTDKLRTEFGILAVLPWDKRTKLDESMVLFKGRSGLKQYNPMEPIKRGYKLWILADMKRYTMKFQIYQGKDEVVTKKFAEYGLVKRVVLELTQAG
ncbi:hypothetical protein PR048_009521 [Dryococelus australis]|uniref:PiggyBac transposable element-derived protein domain-containing protein n=1 Tax=Dryococelus australis TaxID=614101 RepID=A0ABQ9I044_9NEOP|nr:hypothetical protein PR048_009521 [Dryococelus australis]